MELQNRILEKFLINHVDEGVLIIEKLEIGQIVNLLNDLPIGLSSIIVNRLNRFRAARCLEKVSVEFAVKLLEELKPSVNSEIMRMMEPALSSVLLDRLSEELSSQIRQLMQYPSDTAGARMMLAVLTLNEHMRVEEAWKEINAYPELVYSPIFITSDDKNLVGFIEIKALITNDSSTPLRSIMNTRFPTILVNLSVQVLEKKRSEFDSFPMVPVVNIENEFLGLLNIKSIKSDKTDERSNSVQMQQTGIALGDLYHIGLLSFVNTTSEISWTK